MTWSTKLRVLPLVGLTVLALGVAACGDDDGGTKNGGPSDVDSGEGEDGTDGAVRGSMDGGGPRMDATTLPPPVRDGAVSEQPPSDGAVNVTPEQQPDGAVAVPLTPLPNDGNRLSLCYAEGECNGDDLTCYLPDNARPGFCTDDCTQDSDCPLVAGIKQTCSLDGQCRVDCAGTGGGNGLCPPNQICRDISASILLVPPSWRCTYPIGSGSKSVGLYGECDVTHGAGDCQGALGCHAPTGLLFTPEEEGPGYCSTSCKSEAECQLPAGVTSTVMCLGGACEFDCSRKGATCPTNMNCRDVGVGLEEDFRCIVID